MDDQLAIDKIDPGTSNLKCQTGGSAVINYALSNHLVLDVDYFLLPDRLVGSAQFDVNVTDMNGNTIVQILPGYLTPEKQIISFVNVGATFHW